MFPIHWQTDKSFWAFWAWDENIEDYRRTVLQRCRVVFDLHFGIQSSFFFSTAGLHCVGQQFLESIVLYCVWILAKCISTFLCGLCEHSVAALQNVYTFHFFSARWFINWQMLQGWVGEVAVCEVNLHCLDPELWMIIWYCPCLVLGCILFCCFFMIVCHRDIQTRSFLPNPRFPCFVQLNVCAWVLGECLKKMAFLTTQGARQLCNCCYLQYSVTLFYTHIFITHIYYTITFFPCVKRCYFVLSSAVFIYTLL